ncbi:MAG: hypothetical protein ABI830_12660, partial [Pseudolabrys sp.]
MAALPLSLTKMRGIALAVTLLSQLAPNFSGSAQAADAIKGELNVVTDGGYARLVFRFDEEVEANVRVTGPIMVITFKKPVDVSVGLMNANAPDYISAARRDPDGTAIRIALARK